MCDCIEKVNKALAEKNANTRLSLAIRFGNKDTAYFTVLITTEKIDKKKKGKPSTMFPSYCPFCGKKVSE